jgi:hypothetical protein
VLVAVDAMGTAINKTSSNVKIGGMGRPAQGRLFLVITVSNDHWEIANAHYRRSPRPWEPAPAGDSEIDRPLGRAPTAGLGAYWLLGNVNCAFSRTPPEGQR